MTKWLLIIAWTTLQPADAPWEPLVQGEYNSVEMCMLAYEYIHENHMDVIQEHLSQQHVLQAMCVEEAEVVEF